MISDRTPQQDKSLLPAEGTTETWRAVTDLYTDFLEVWSVGEDGTLQSLIAQIPVDPEDNTRHKHACAHLIASAPTQFRALQQAPQPPASPVRSANRSKLEDQLLAWIKLEYLPWYEFQRSQAIAKARGEVQSASAATEI